MDFLNRDFVKDPQIRHLQDTYKACGIIRTFLSPDQPAFRVCTIKFTC